MLNKVLREKQSGYFFPAFWVPCLSSAFESESGELNPERKEIDLLWCYPVFRKRHLGQFFHSVTFPQILSWGAVKPGFEISSNTTSQIPNHEDRAFWCLYKHNGWCCKDISPLLHRAVFVIVLPSRSQITLYEMLFLCHNLCSLFLNNNHISKMSDLGGNTSSALELIFAKAFARLG